jgi:hypothetical protein
VRIADPVADDVAGAREMGFSLPQQYGEPIVGLQRVGRGWTRRDKQL